MGLKISTQVMELVQDVEVKICNTINGLNTTELYTLMVKTSIYIMKSLLQKLGYNDGFTTL